MTPRWKLRTSIATRRCTSRCWLNSRRREPNRDADPGRHAPYLHRLLSRGSPDRGRTFPVHTTRPRGGIRDDHLVPAVAQTLVTAMTSYLLPGRPRRKPRRRIMGPLSRRLRARVRALRTSYRAALTAFIAHKTLSLTCVALMILASGLLPPVVGEDFFPQSTPA